MLQSSHKTCKLLSSNANSGYRLRGLMWSTCIFAPFSVVSPQILHFEPEAMSTEIRSSRQAFVL